MLLEAEVAIRLDEVYARDVETRLSKRAAEIARREEVERMERFREATRRAGADQPGRAALQAGDSARGRT